MLTSRSRSTAEAFCEVKYSQWILKGLLPPPRVTLVSYGIFILWEVLVKPNCQRYTPKLTKHRWCYTLKIGHAQRMSVNECNLLNLLMSSAITGTLAKRSGAPYLSPALYETSQLRRAYHLTLTYGSTGVLTRFCTQILDGNKFMGVCEFSRSFQHFFQLGFWPLKPHGQPCSKNECSNGLYLWSLLELNCQGHTAGAGRSLEFWLKIKTPSCQAPLFEAWGCFARDWGGYLLEDL